MGANFIVTFFSVMDLSQLTEINLLQSLQLHNTTFAGVQQKPGPHSPSPAAFFSGNSLESDLLDLFINIDCFQDHHALSTTAPIPVTPSHHLYSLPKSFPFLPQSGKIAKILELSLHFPMANTKQIGEIIANLKRIVLKSSI